MGAYIRFAVHAVSLCLIYNQVHIFQPLQLVLARHFSLQPIFKLQHRMKEEHCQWWKGTTARLKPFLQLLHLMSHPGPPVCMFAAVDPHI